MKVTTIKLKVPRIEAIRILREDTQMTINECQNFLNDHDNKTQIVEKHTREYDLLEKIYDMTAEPYSYEEKADLMLIKNREEKQQKTDKAWKWINDNVSDEGKQYIQYLVDNGGVGPAHG